MPDTEVELLGSHLIDGEICRNKLNPPTREQVIRIVNEAYEKMNNVIAILDELDQERQETAFGSI